MVRIVGFTLLHSRERGREWGTKKDREREREVKGKMEGEIGERIKKELE